MQKGAVSKNYLYLKGKEIFQEKKYNDWKKLVEAYTNEATENFYEKQIILLTVIDVVEALNDEENLSEIKKLYNTRTGTLPKKYKIRAQILIMSYHIKGKEIFKI